MWVLHWHFTRPEASNAGSRSRVGRVPRTAARCRTPPVGDAAGGVCANAARLRKNAHQLRTANACSYNTKGEELDGIRRSLAIGNGLPPSQNPLVIDLCERLLVERDASRRSCGNSGRRGPTPGRHATSCT